MKLQNAIKKMEQAGAIVTSQTDSRNNVTTYYAKFENTTIDFIPDEDGDVDYFSRIYGTDEGSQEQMRFFYDTAKAAIRNATRG
jgi:hypothetical protein